jgi:hypothetical protein
MTYLSYYLICGVIWALLNESNIQNNGHRFRMIVFWPVTFTAFIIGFIEALIGNNGEE